MQSKLMIIRSEDCVGIHKSWLHPLERESSVFIGHDDWLGLGAVYICFVSMSSISERVDQA